MKWFSHLDIAHKISYSFALTIGIATLGVSSGLIVGDAYQRRAQELIQIADEQRYLLSELDKAVLEVQNHPQRLIAVLGDSIWFQYETTQFLNDVEQVIRLTTDLSNFSADQTKSLAIQDESFQELLQTYIVTTQAYRRLMETLWNDLDPANLTETELKEAREQLLGVITSEEAVQLDIVFERLAEQLAQDLAAAQEQHQRATQAFEVAEQLRLRIILLSILSSVIVAAVLAVWIGRAIARPLQAVTQVAEQVIQESDFTLQAPITSHDETGSLAQSLNQLIQWVGEYTQELEQAQALLEQRVKERTEELTEAIADLKQAQLQLVQSEKMSSLGQLVAGVAHEINNPVNFIYGNLSYATRYAQDLLQVIHHYQQQYPCPPPALQTHLEDLDLEFMTEDLPKLLKSMRVGAERIREIVQSLRTFSRLDEADMKIANIHEGIDSTLMILQSRLKAKPNHPEIQVVKEYGGLPLIECYPGQLNQVFMNILSNAIDALEEPRIRSRREEYPGERGVKVSAGSASPTIHIRTERLGKDWVAIHITDNGPGMTDSVRKKLFNPFFTTKPVGQGTGLGLSISYQIVVDGHGGNLRCLSQLGKGTEFIIEIPVQQYAPLPLHTKLAQS